MCWYRLSMHLGRKPIAPWQVRIMIHGHGVVTVCGGDVVHGECDAKRLSDERRSMSALVQAVGEREVWGFGISAKLTVWVQTYRSG